MTFIIVFILDFFDAMPLMWRHSNEWLYDPSYDE